MFPCFLPTLASALLFFSHSSDNAPLSADASSVHDPINTVIGNESFRARFGREPTVTDDDRLRIATHLQYVEEKLRARPVNHLSPELQAERLRNLDRLRQYHLRGKFPRNYDMPERRPCFIDRDGTICAVGYLVEQSAGLNVAEGINNEYQYARIGEMKTPVLVEWIVGSGLTPEEVAMIQPEYVERLNPSDIGITLGGGIVAQNDYPSATMNGMPVAGSQSGLGGTLSGGLYFDIPLGSAVIHRSGAVEVFIDSNNVQAQRPPVNRSYPLQKVYLHLRPRVEYRWGSFTGAGVAMTGTNGVDTVADMPTQYGAGYHYASLNTDLLIGYYIGKKASRSPLQILAGASVGIGGAFADAREERLTPADGHSDMRLLQSRGGEVSSDEQGLMLRKGEIDDVPGLRFGLKGGVRVKDVLYVLRYIPCLPMDIYASCSLWYTHDLTPLVSGSEWRSQAVQLTLDVSLGGRQELW